MMTTLNAVGHLGYEIYPKGFTKNKIWKWKTTSTHHNMHHEKFRGNYGVYFTFWDRWFKTEFKDYHQVFENIANNEKSLHQPEKAINTIDPLVSKGFNGLLVAQELNPKSILGNWAVQSEDAIVAIFVKDNKYFGKIIWLKTLLDNNGVVVKDSNNVDKKLRTKPALGLVILKDFEFTQNNTWEGGTIYDPKNGKTYSCIIKVKNKSQLEIRGYIGISLLGRTEIWMHSK